MFPAQAVLAALYSSLDINQCTPAAALLSGSCALKLCCTATQCHTLTAYVIWLQQNKDLKQVRTQLAAQQAATEQSQQQLTTATQEGVRLTDQLQDMGNRAQQLEAVLSTTQADADSTKAELAMRRQQQIDTQQQLLAIQTATQQQVSEVQQHKSQLQAKLYTTDFEYVEALKQLKQARTGLANLRNRLDDSETELRTSRVQNSLQVNSYLSAEAGTSVQVILLQKN